MCVGGATRVLVDAHWVGVGRSLEMDHVVTNCFLFGLFGGFSAEHPDALEWRNNCPRSSLLGSDAKGLTESCAKHVWMCRARAGISLYYPGTSAHLP